ncbi:MAG: NFACT family protein [Candidatus Melainabacteria bacterium]|nr:NFACT family protein [Candidatus Melainabacteria bacterium]
MQPFDALTAKAVLEEAQPLLVGRKVDKIHQVGRDEVVLSLRNKGGFSHLLLSAHPVFGRICLSNLPHYPRQSTPPAFCFLLRKHLCGSTLVGVEQLVGERIVDLVFSCPGDLGLPVLKVLSVEIMGRHSNLILWDKESNFIFGASHVVTKDMSRQRQLAVGLKYVRPPGQNKPNLFKVTAGEFAQCLETFQETFATTGNLAEWLVSTFSGLGRHLAEELVVCYQTPALMPGGIQEFGGGLNASQTDLKDSTLKGGVSMEQNFDKLITADQTRSMLWEKIASLRTGTRYKPAMCPELGRYTILSWGPETANQTQWKLFPSVNDLVDEYYRVQVAREHFLQLKDRLHLELKTESERISSRVRVAEQYLDTQEDMFSYKKFGDLILANIKNLCPGQVEVTCEDIYQPGHFVTIALNPNLTPSQNAQQYYRRFAKTRTRLKAASEAKKDADSRLMVLANHLETLEKANSTEELESLRAVAPGVHLSDKARSRPAKKQGKNKLLSITSSDGFTIYIGRNRQENDDLIAQLARPQDVWLHVLGTGGAHVLIRMPSSKSEVPRQTLKEAAQAAARFSKATKGCKVRVVYTQCKFVKKTASKPGLVTYENEKTMEVDTASPMPWSLKQLFAYKHVPCEKLQ